MASAMVLMRGPLVELPQLLPICILLTELEHIPGRNALVRQTTKGLSRTFPTLSPIAQPIAAMPVDIVDRQYLRSRAWVGHPDQFSQVVLVRLLRRHGLADVLSLGVQLVVPALQERGA
jgi:hypothetical protein